MRLEIEISITGPTFGDCDQEMYARCAELLHETANKLQRSNTPSTMLRVPILDGAGNDLGTAKFQW